MDEFDDGREKKHVHQNALTEIAIKLQSAIASAELFVRQGHFAAADKAYSIALGLKPNDTHLLLYRSRCRVLGGNPEGGLIDAEAVLSIEPNSIRGILCKADAQFGCGNFELALVYYSRGVRMADTLHVEEFSRGVSRCTEAIDIAMKAMDLEKVKKYREAQKMQQHKSDGKHHKEHPGSGGRLVRKLIRKSEAAIENIEANSNPVLTKEKKFQQDRVDQHLLDELYEDYAFLKGLSTDPVIMEAANGTVAPLVLEGIAYFEARKEYWIARNPTHEKVM